MKGADIAVLEKQEKSTNVVESHHLVDFGVQQLG